jgi:hypothetical protein
MLRMARPRSKTHIRCVSCGMMSCDCQKMFKTQLAWWEDAEDRARLDGYCMQDVRTVRALCDVLRPLSRSERELWLADQVVNERSRVINPPITEHTPSIASDPTVITEVKPQGAPEIVPDWIRDHVQLIHTLAKPLAGQGKVVATGFGEDPGQTDPKTGKPGRRLPSLVVHADVGDVQATWVVSLSS